MKKLLSYFILGATAMSALTACSLFSRTITVVNFDGTETQIEFQKSFNYEVPEVEGYYFLGCFEENNAESKQYVSNSGESVTWNSGFPKKIYAVYLEKKNLYTFEQSYGDITLSSPGQEKGIKYQLAETYSTLFGDLNYVGMINVQLEHFEKEEGIAGVK